MIPHIYLRLQVNLQLVLGRGHLFRDLGHLPGRRRVRLETSRWASTISTGLTMPDWSAVPPDPVRDAGGVVSWATRTPVKLRMETTAPGNYQPILVQTMMKEVVRLFPEQPALAIKRDQHWQRWNYAEYYADVKNVAKAFLTLGLPRFHGVGIMGTNCPEWFVSCLASVFAGGLACGIYNTSSPAILTFISSHAPLDLLVIEDSLWLHRILDGRKFSDALPNVRKVVCICGPVDDEEAFEDRVITWNDLLEMGAEKSDEIIEECEKQQAVNDACVMVYTSGTTGPPKGAMLCHDNVTWTSRVAMEHHGFKNETVVSFLPLSHIAPLMIDCFMSMNTVSTTSFADKNALRGTLVESLKEVRPTKFYAVPRVWEKMRERMEEKLENSGAVKSAIVRWANQVSREQLQAENSGKVTEQSLSYKVANKILFSRVREALGLSRTKATISTASKLHESTYEFFHGWGINLLELYGSTETSGPISINMPGASRPGSVGSSYTGIHNKILNPDETGLGEVATSARNVFMGYHDDERRTREAFTADFKYFRTGDLGRFDADGFLTLSGRLKELIITSGGENIAPLHIEENIRQALSEVVSNVIVVGDGRKFLTCLLTLKVVVDNETQNPTHFLDHTVQNWATRVLGDDHGEISTIHDFLTHSAYAKLHDAIQGTLEVANEKAVSRANKIQKFRILPNELSIAGGELGPTLKIRRYFVYKKYHNLIESMYE